MAEVGPTGLPLGTFDLKIGSSYNKGRKKTEYHTLRYDFKPKSIGNQTETFIAVGSSDEVQIAITSENKDDITTYKGAKKPLKDGKECLLIFDETTGEMRIEKIASNMNVKQTRKTNDDSNSYLKEEVMKMRKHKSKSTTSSFQQPVTTSPPKPPTISLPKPQIPSTKPLTPPEPAEVRHEEKKEKEKSKHVDHMSSSSDSDSSSSDSSDSSDESDNEEEKTKKPESSKEALRNRVESSNFSSDDEAALEQHLNAAPTQSNKSSLPDNSSFKSQQQVDSLFDDMDMPDLSAPAPAPSKPPPPQAPPKKLEHKNQMLLQNDLDLSESSDED